MPKRLSEALYYLSLMLIVILGIVLFRLIKIYDIFCTILQVASPVVFGYIFAWILHPIYKKLSSRMNKYLAVGILIFAFLLVYVIIIYKLIPVLTMSGMEFLGSLEKYISKISEISFLSSLKEFSNIDMNTIIDSCSNLVSGVVGFFLIHIFGFYILCSYESVNAYLRSLIPSKYKRGVLEYVRKMSSTMRVYIRATLIDTAILMIISSILYVIIGLDYPFILAIVSAITNIIPFIGPYIGGILAVIVALGKSVKLGIITVGAVILAQTLESNIVNPVIMSKCIKINPILIIISLSIMGKFFGLVGMIFAVPTLIIVKVSYEAYKKYKVDQ